MQYKSKYTGAEIDSILDKANAGSGIAIVDSTDQLDPKAELGSLASVVEPGSIKESSFRDLYQPDASIIDQESGTLTTPELLSSVSSVSVLAPEDVTSVGFETVESSVYLVPRDFSMTNETMAMVRIALEGVMGMTVIGGYDNMQQFVLAEYSQDTMNYTIHNDQVEAFNAVLANGMDWCYLGAPENGFVITEEQFATIDLFISAVADVPSKAHVYLKKDNWEELYAKDLEKLQNDIKLFNSNIYNEIDNLHYNIAKKANPISIESYSGRVSPNVYTTHTINSTANSVIKLSPARNTSIYNEYVMEIKCTATPSVVDFKDSNNNTISIKWANDNIPIFEAGYTYIISIVNNLGVFAKFTNS